MGQITYKMGKVDNGKRVFYFNNWQNYDISEKIHITDLIDFIGITDYLTLSFKMLLVTLKSSLTPTAAKKIKSLIRDIPLSNFIGSKYYKARKQ